MDDEIVAEEDYLGVVLEQEHLLLRHTLQVSHFVHFSLKLVRIVQDEVLELVVLGAVISASQLQNLQQLLCQLHQTDLILRSRLGGYTLDVYSNYSFPVLVYWPLPRCNATHYSL